MKDLLKEIRKGIAEETGKQIALSLLPLVLSLLRELPISQIDSIFSGVSSRIWYYSVAILLTINIQLVVSYRKLKKSTDSRLKMEDFEFLKEIGIYRNKIDNLYYCTSCLLATPAVRSPLREQENGWSCEIKTCDKFYYNPNYHEKPTFFRDPDPFHGF